MPKALLTVVVGEDKLLIPFPTDRTCADLLEEVRRRSGITEEQLSALRVQGPDGPKLFGEDLIEDILDGNVVFFAGTAEPACVSPVHAQSLSPLLSIGLPHDRLSRLPELADRPPEGDDDFVVRERDDDFVARDRYGPSLETGNSDDSVATSKGERGTRGKEMPSPDALPSERTIRWFKREARPEEMWYFTPPQRMPKRESERHRPVKKERTDSYTEAVSDRRVDWVIVDIKEKLTEYPKGTRMFSPLFSASGILDLGLVLYPCGNSSAKPGFCSLGLKAPHGAHLRYKLYVEAVEKFTELRQNVTESWGFVDMCRLDEVVNADSGQNLRVGIEIIDDIDVNEELIEVGPTKIEWTIRNVTVKQKYYRKDVALYSEEFSIAGVDRLRMKLYPNGKDGAVEGWCSLYLEAPKGSELRCRLYVGKKGMSFDRVEKFGEDSIWGFLTFCRLQEEVVDDTLRVGLVVLETRRLDPTLTDAEDAYLKSLSAERRAWLLDELQRVDKVRNSSEHGNVPSRFRILQLDLPDTAKAVALAKLESLSSDMMSAEGTKLKRWIDGVLQLPFGKIKKPIVSLGEGQEAVRNYLQRAQQMLNSAVFGHDEPKEKIMQVLCQWIANPESQNLVLGIQGPPGNGKTTLCRKGIAEALSRPFVQISLGGATDASVLEGHSYTYVGSSWGRIAGLLMETQCMNPVIFFDELDKVSETPRGEEINGVLTHLTDHSQNMAFADRYFDGIPLDMTKVMFIFSFNEDQRITPVLKDRLTIIKTQGFEREAKRKIAQKFLLPELLKNVGMNEGDVVLREGMQGVADISYLQERWGCASSSEPGGVRGLKQALEAIVLHVNKLRLLQPSPAERDTPVSPTMDTAESPSKETASPGKVTAFLSFDAASPGKEEALQDSPREAEEEPPCDKATAADSPESASPDSASAKVEAVESPTSASASVSSPAAPESATPASANVPSPESPDSAVPSATVQESAEDSPREASPRESARKESPRSCDGESPSRAEPSGEAELYSDPVLVSPQSAKRGDADFETSDTPRTPDAKESAYESSDYEGLKLAAEITLPLTLTRELIDVLLPHREPEDIGSRGMYI